MTSSFSVGTSLGSHRAGPAPPQGPRAVLTGGRSASRPHRGHRGPGGWRTAHLRDRRESSDTACTASQEQRREQCPPAAPRWIPARAGLTSVHRIGGSRCHCETRQPQALRLCTLQRVSPTPRDCPCILSAARNTHGPAPGAHPLSIPVLGLSPTAPRAARHPWAAAGPQPARWDLSRLRGLWPHPVPPQNCPQHRARGPQGSPRSLAQVGPTPLPPPGRCHPPQAPRQPRTGQAPPPRGCPGMPRVPCPVSPVPTLTVTVRHRCVPSSAARPFRSALPSQHTPRRALPLVSEARRALPLAGVIRASAPIGGRGKAGDPIGGGAAVPPSRCCPGREDGGGRCEEHRGRAGPWAEGAPHPPVPALR